jgi:hypothetical protein
MLAMQLVFGADPGACEYRYLSFLDFFEQVF